MDSQDSPPLEGLEGDTLEGLEDDDDEEDFKHLYGPHGFRVPIDDPKWAFLREEEEEKPIITIEERIRLREEKEARMRLEMLSRARVPNNIIPPKYVPVVEKKPTIEEKRAKYQAWLEKLEGYRKEREALMIEHRRKARLEYEKYAKIQKENRTRDYYWKPDPLFAMHLRDMGYSKIAADKALFYVDNKSVDLALEYLRQNPNVTELTKEEVLAVGEEVLRRIRPVKPPVSYFSKENNAEDDHMEVESASQAGMTSDSQNVPEDLPTKEADKFVSTEGGIDQVASTAVLGQATSSAVNDQDVPAGVNDKNELEDEKSGIHRMSKGSRGQKRNHDGQAIEHVPVKRVVSSYLPVVNEIVPNRRMVFVVNTRLLMDAVTLSLEVGKAAVRIMDIMASGTDEQKKDQEEWIKDGSAMAMFKGNDSEHLYRVLQGVQKHGLIHYLAECSHYRHVKTPSPTVLGVFADKNIIRKMSLDLQRM